MSSSTGHEGKPNRLIAESSPYLLQHAHNPVNWYAWGPEALERARAEAKPIFLSIGYSACHWCHVMERESFENPRIAALMNENFINIKVDREERPDLDQIYMAAVQAMTGHGGWPMSVFLTPDQKPFFGGTYFPPEDARGMAGFDRVLMSVAQAWANRRDEITQAADGMTEQLGGLTRVPAPDAIDPDLNPRLLDEAARALARSFDSVHGGFGSAPKFPHPMDLKVLLRQYARTGDVHALHMVRHTLDKMARGGIHDHLGGGFARYSTDERWLVPHFEKMLYDNALLASVYLEAHQATRDPEDARIARQTIDYVLERMTGDDGEFYSTEDADSEGEEGKYYVWTSAEINAILSAEAAKTFAYVYDVTDQGNWEGRNILNLTKPFDQAARMLGRDEAELRAELAESRSKLLAARSQRIAPAKDTKVIAAWNGMMLAALAPAAAILKHPGYVEAAERNASFLLDRMRREDGTLLHTYRNGKARLHATVDDYACVIDGLTRLFEATGGARWIEAAIDLATIMIDHFNDPEAPGFYFTGKDHEALIVRPKELLDNATPAGNAMAATALARLAALTGREAFREQARRALTAVLGVMREYPSAAGQSLIALDFLLAKPREIAVVAGNDAAEYRAIIELIGSRYLPNAVVAPASVAPAARLMEKVPLLDQRPAREGRATVYVCEAFACKAPVSGVDAVAAAL